jgi:ABC-2 type transport system ATP-binding protein
MALTAEELIVIGRGRLIAQSSTNEFVDRASGTTVRVRSPQLDQLQDVLKRDNLVTRIDEIEGQGKVLIVEGDVSTDAIGEAAAAQGVTLHELTLVRGSLEAAFMQLTGDTVEYHAHGLEPQVPAAAGQIPAVPPTEVAAGPKEDN